MRHPRSIPFESSCILRFQVILREVAGSPRYCSPRPPWDTHGEFWLGVHAFHGVALLASIKPSLDILSSRSALKKRCFLSAAPTGPHPSKSSCAKKQDLHGIARSRYENTRGDSATALRSAQNDSTAKSTAMYRHVPPWDTQVPPWDTHVRLVERPGWGAVNFGGLFGKGGRPVLLFPWWRGKGCAGCGFVEFC